jgi:hypothetical protein
LCASQEFVSDFQIRPAKRSLSSSTAKMFAYVPLNLKFQISNLTFSRPFTSLHRSVFARAPMILPGTPFSRPCALAKTPARTRKHCDFSRLPLRARESDNVHIQTALPPRLIHQPLLAWLCALNTYMACLFLAPLLRLAVFFHLFLILHLPPSPSSPGPITSTVPSLWPPACRTHSFTGIISPSHFQCLDSSNAAPSCPLFLLAMNCPAKKTRHIHPVPLSPFMPIDNGNVIYPIVIGGSL